MIIRKIYLWINVKNIFRVLLIPLLSIIIVEIIYRGMLNLTLSDQNLHRLDTYLYSVGNNFVIYDNFFKYIENESIRTVKLKGNNLNNTVIAYDYIIETNNAGLVMNNDLFQQEQVIYIVGDSFTEGQGYTPWFYDYEKKNERKLKVVNLGILGTGPSQWLNLAKHIGNRYKLRVNGMVINLIVDDLTRKVWAFDSVEQKCLLKGICPYEGSFQGFNFINFSKILNKDSNLSTLSKSTFSMQDVYFLDWIKNILKKSLVIKDIYSLYRNTSFQREFYYQKNKIALLNLKKIANSNLVINLISQKDNQIYPKDFIEFLKLNDINFNYCKISSAEFQLLDSHPNEMGYERVKECTRHAELSLI